MTSPAVICYGNCQAQILAACLNSLPGLQKLYQVTSFLDFDVPGGEARQLPPQDLLDRCEVLILQVALKRAEPEFAKQTASRGTKVIRIPALSCPPLWPQDCPDIRNRPEPKYPFGRYPYGDRLLLDLMDQGKDDSAIANEYLASDLSSLFDLNRAMDYWRYTLAELDSRCDIRAGSFIRNAFQSKRLFYTRNHPSHALVHFCLREVVALAWGRGTPDAHLEFAAAIPTDRYMTPVHPSVARALGLQWCGENTLHRHWENGHFTHREFARRYVRYDG